MIAPIEQALWFVNGGGASPRSPNLQHLMRASRSSKRPMHSQPRSHPNLSTEWSPVIAL